MDFRAVDAFIVRPHGARLPSIVLPADTTCVKPELTMPEVEQSAAGFR
jgi:hypothetical protein